MGSRVNWRAANGQQRIASAGGGFLMDSVNYDRDGIASGSLPLVDVPVYTAPPADTGSDVLAATVDVEPLTQGPQYRVRRAILTLGTTVAAGANNPSYLLRLWRAGVLVGTIATWDGTAVSFTNNQGVTRSGAQLTNNELLPGDVITLRINTNGAGGVASQPLSVMCEWEA